MQGTTCYTCREMVDDYPDNPMAIATAKLLCTDPYIWEKPGFVERVLEGDVSAGVYVGIVLWIMFVVAGAGAGAYYYCKKKKAAEALKNGKNEPITDE